MWWLPLDLEAVLSVKKLKQNSRARKKTWRNRKYCSSFNNGCLPCGKSNMPNTMMCNLTGTGLSWRNVQKLARQCSTVTAQLVEGSHNVIGTCKVLKTNLVFPGQVQNRTYCSNPSFCSWILKQHAHANAPHASNLHQTLVKHTIHLCMVSW